MTISELKTYLKEHLVPSKLYEIGGESNGRICLAKVNDFWEVFFVPYSISSRFAAGNLDNQRHPHQKQDKDHA